MLHIFNESCSGHVLVRFWTDFGRVCVGFWSGFGKVFVRPKKYFNQVILKINYAKVLDKPGSGGASQARKTS